MLRRLFDFVAIVLLVAAIIAGGWGLRSHFYTDAIALFPGGTLVRFDTVPGKLRIEVAPRWPYPDRVATGWTAWRHGPDHPAPILGASSTNRWGFGYDHSEAIVVTGEEDESDPQPQARVSDYSVIIPWWVLSVLLAIPPLMYARSRIRERRLQAALRQGEVPLASDCLPEARHPRSEGPG